MEKSTFSRRTFIEMLGVSAAGFGLVSLAGCSSGGDTSAPSTDAGSTGTTGGAADAITYSLTADPRAVDPAYFDDGESAVVSCNIYEAVPVRRQGREGCAVSGHRSARDLGRRPRVHHQAARGRQVP
ncbi:hypothetical protein [Eggerthella sinensis]|uniref:hypothetical protein n=1 Tax=Eggerthella sinensis TaxID=242230 RepID=UPI0022E2A379|nr:hypothetical protein [Eggerthella sinensis]